MGARTAREGRRRHSAANRQLTLNEAVLQLAAFLIPKADLSAFGT